MVAGLFMPWLNPETAGLRLVPWDIVKGLEPSLEEAQRFASNSPVELLVFLSTFVFAGLFAVLAMIGAPVRLLAFLAGGGAVGVTAYAVWQLRDKAQALGLPVPSAENLAEFAKSAPDAFGFGAFAWAGGAVVLLFTALVGFRAR